LPQKKQKGGEENRKSVKNRQDVQRKTRGFGDEIKKNPVDLLLSFVELKNNNLNHEYRGPIYLFVWLSIFYFGRLITK
jgi:hypothetical protein